MENSRTPMKAAKTAAQIAREDAITKMALEQFSDGRPNPIAERMQRELQAHVDQLIASGVSPEVVKAMVPKLVSDWKLRVVAELCR